jgi:hypothetical protein
MKLQEFFCRTALAEHGITDVSIEEDHIRGLTFINGHQFGIKYPLAYVNKINELSREKKYEYCFLGKFGKLRGQLLERFIGDNSKIGETRNGRDPNTKYTFDTEYFQTISNTKYSLCPNQGNDKKYKHEYGWTYRLIETVLCKSVPIVFRDTPYGEKFIKDIEFLWDDTEHNLTNDQYYKLVERNYLRGLTNWTFQPDEIELIRSTQLKG